MMLNPTTLAQLNETLEAIRHQFQRGGSFWAILCIMAVIGTVFLVAYVLSRRQQHVMQSDQEPDPVGVFQRTLERLPLTVGQRRMLSSFASDLNLEHPTVMLLSSALLYESARRWRERHPAHAADDQALDRFLQDVTPVLFPTTVSAPPTGSSVPAAAPSSQAEERVP